MAARGHFAHEKTPERCGIRNPTLGCWVTLRGTIHDDDEPEARNKVARIVVKRHLQCAATCTSIQSMNKCGDDATMAEFRKLIRSQQDRAMFETLHTDNVCMSTRAHMRWGYAHECPRGGGEQAVWGHVVDRCTQTGRANGIGDVPYCLRYTGSVRSG